MAMQTIANPPFEPAFTVAQVKENLSAERCRERDVTRRVAALVCARSAAQLEDWATSDPEVMLSTAEKLAEFEKHIKAETEVVSAALARLLWALDKHHGDDA